MQELPNINILKIAKPKNGKTVEAIFCHNSTTSLFKIISEVDFVTLSDLYVLGFFSKYYANEVRQLTTNFNIRVYVIQIPFWIVFYVT